MSSRPSSALGNALAGRLRGGSAPQDRHAILVIDDDKASRESLKFIFEDQYELVMCSSAKEGIAAVHEDICAVILDVRMPEQDGFSACEEIRRKFPDMPVIFYSAYQSAKDPIEIINEYHPLGYVVKGGDLQRLVKLVALAVQLQSIVVQNRKLIRRLQASKSPGR